MNNKTKEIFKHTIKAYNELLISKEMEQIRKDAEAKEIVKKLLSGH